MDATSPNSQSEEELRQAEAEWYGFVLSELRVNHKTVWLTSGLVYIAILTIARHPLHFTLVTSINLALAGAANHIITKATPKKTKETVLQFGKLSTVNAMTTLPLATYFGGSTGPSWIVCLAGLLILAFALPSKPRPIPMLALGAASLLAFWLSGASSGQLIPAMAVVLGSILMTHHRATITEKNNRLHQLSLSKSTILNQNLRAATQRSQKYAQNLETANKRAELTMRQLTLAKERAEAAGRSKADFLANMSHEIRTPLNGIMGMLDILDSDSSLSPSQKEHVQIANRSAKDLLTIISDILDFSKIEAGQLDIEHIAFNPRQRLEDTARLFDKGVNKGSDVRFQIQFDPDLPTELLGDPTRIHQIISNFLSNAFKFTKAGTVTLSAKSLGLSDNHCLIEFSVQDSGLGIPTHRLPVIFDKFTQADSSTTREYGGTGLGLAICKQLAGLMDGEVGAQSQPGEGSTFWLRLPFNLSKSEVAKPIPTLVIADKKTVQPDRPSPRVLIVEDNQVNQFVAKRFLLRLGCTVDICANGLIAVQKVQSHNYDLVLMDCQMPVMSGFDATIAIRKAEKDTGERIKIIALTASVMDQDRKKCRAAGMDEVLSKPMEFDRLQTVVSRLLNLDYVERKNPQEALNIQQPGLPGARKIKGTQPQKASQR